MKSKSGVINFMKSNTFGHGERLKSEKAISTLFETGSSISVQPIRLLYQKDEVSANATIKIGFAVSKKNFKRSVDRNLLKRRMREAYRLNKALLVNENAEITSGLNIMLIYQGHIIEDFNKINLCIINLLKKLIHKVSV